MIRAGRIVLIGDEFLELVALATGVDAYLFNNDCKSLLEWLSSNIENYDVIVYLGTIRETCTDFEHLLKRFEHSKITLMIEHPIKRPPLDPRDFYREVARRVLGIEILI